MLKTIARENDCYKVILDCNDEVKKSIIVQDLKKRGYKWEYSFRVK